MGKLRIPEFQMFSMEMVRAALRSDAIPEPFRVISPWRHLDMAPSKDKTGGAQILIAAWNTTPTIEAYCRPQIKVEGAWTQGTCEIGFLDDDTTKLEFVCYVKDDHIVAVPIKPRPSSLPQS